MTPSIPFFTLIDYQEKKTSLTEYSLSSISRLYFLGGKTIQVLNKNTKEINLQSTSISWVTIGLKIAFHASLFYFNPCCAIILLSSYIALRAYQNFKVIEIPEKDKSSQIISTISISKERVKHSPQINALEVLHNPIDELNRQSISWEAQEETSDSPLHLKIIDQDHSDFNLTIRKQDIFKSKANVIVNAANTHLGGGGGIDGAIHQKGGSQYVEAHRQLKNHYQSSYTQGYAAIIDSGLLKNLGFEKVMVIAGPSKKDGCQVTQEDRTALYSCYYNSLCLANDQEYTSIAFPLISTGVFKFPKDLAAQISLQAIFDFIKQHPQAVLKTISLHTQDIDDLQYYKTALAQK